MKYFDWNSKKNQELQSERGISFEDVVIAIFSGKLHDVIANPKRSQYPNQRLYIIEHDEYVYVVPFVEDENKIFLKTIYPSRVLTRKYIKGG